MAAAFLVSAVLLLAGCADREHRNPLDPLSPGSASGEVRALASVAGDGRVDLSWDYGQYADLRGFRLYRGMEGEGQVFRPLAVLGTDADSYADRQVDNGVTYAYRLGLEVDGEGERLLAGVVWATPGPEVAWAADRRGGLVWKVAADARSAHFVRGHFASIEGMALDAGNGGVWVSDRYFAGLYRIGPDGDLTEHPGAVAWPGLVAADLAGGPVWLVDRQPTQVTWFLPDQVADTLALGVVDASFAVVGGLAPQAGGCWISDPEEGRVLYYHPGGERAEFAGLDRPGPLAADRDRSAWVLAAGGQVLVRLDRGSGGAATTDLGPRTGRAVAVDPVAAHVWVLGASSMWSFDASGRPLREWDGLEEATDLALDMAAGRVWVATESYLQKQSLEGEVLGMLAGFYGLLEVAVDPGRVGGSQEGQTSR